MCLQGAKFGWSNSWHGKVAAPKPTAGDIHASNARGGGGAAGVRATAESLARAGDRETLQNILTAALTQRDSLLAQTRTVRDQPAGEDADRRRPGETAGQGRLRATAVQRQEATAKLGVQVFGLFFGGLIWRYGVAGGATTIGSIAVTLACTAIIGTVGIGKLLENADKLLRNRGRHDHRDRRYQCCCRGLRKPSPGATGQSTGLGEQLSMAVVVVLLVGAAMVVMIPIAIGIITTAIVSGAGYTMLSEYLIWRVITAAIGYGSFAVYCCVVISLLAKSSWRSRESVRRVAGGFIGAHIRAAKAVIGERGQQAEAAPGSAADASPAAAGSAGPGADGSGASLARHEAALQRLLDSGTNDQAQVGAILAEMDRLRAAA